MQGRGKKRPPIGSLLTLEKKISVFLPFLILIMVEPPGSSFGLFSSEKDVQKIGFIGAKLGSPLSLPTQ